jgi:hypothetical protein
MLPYMRRIFGGATLVVVGIAAFIEAYSHRPVIALSELRAARMAARGETPPHSGLSQTPYDLLRIGAWALVIFGGLLVTVGLMRYWARVKRPG